MFIMVYSLDINGTIWHISAPRARPRRRRGVAAPVPPSPVPRPPGPAAGAARRSFHKTSRTLVYIYMIHKVTTNIHRCLSCRSMPPIYCTAVLTVLVYDRPITLFIQIHEMKLESCASGCGFTDYAVLRPAQPILSSTCHVRHGRLIGRTHAFQPAWGPPPKLTQLVSRRATPPVTSCARAVTFDKRHHIER